MWKPLWVQKWFDDCADRAARPVRWRHLIVFAGIGALGGVGDTPWSAIALCIVLLWFALALANRHEALEYFRARGIDPYNKKQVKEDAARLHRELQEKGIIPPD